MILPESCRAGPAERTRHRPGDIGGSAARDPPYRTATASSATSVAWLLAFRRALQQCHGALADHRRAATAAAAAAFGDVERREAAFVLQIDPRPRRQQHL